MKSFRQMSLASFDHQPGDRQSPLSVDQADHQCDTLVPYLTPIDGKGQCLRSRKPDQQLPHKREVTFFALNLPILYPAAVALDPAIRFGMIRRFARNGGQLTTFAKHYPADHGCQRRQSSGLVSFGFAGIQLNDCLSNGTICSTIVTHEVPPVISLRKLQFTSCDSRHCLKSVR